MRLQKIFNSNAGAVWSKVEVYVKATSIKVERLRSCHPAKFAKIFLLKFKFSQILLGEKNATSLCSKIISTLIEPHLVLKHISYLSTPKNLFFKISNARYYSQFCGILEQGREQK